MLLAIKSMGGEGEAAWRALLDDLVRRGLPTPGAGSSSTARRVLEKALAALWPDMAVQRCTVHKHRNLLAHAPERLHEEISNDYRDMIYAATRGEVETRPASGVHPQMAAQEPRRRRQPGGSRRQAVPHSRGSRRANGNRSEPRTRSSDCTEEFKRRIKTPDRVLPCADTAAMLFWALLASGQIIMRKVDGWHTLAEKPDDQIIDLAA